MRLQEIMGFVREYFFLALSAVSVLGIMFFIGYFIVYRKFLRGTRRLPKLRLLFVGLFTGYVIMVIGVTFLSRDSNFQGAMNLSFLSSYKEAWYSFSVRNWQFVYLNIFMFVPFGILFPFMHSQFQKAVWTIGMAALFTFSIETIQLIAGYGVFEVDDLFNNLLGAIIGYGIIMGLISIKDKGIKQSLLYFLPLLLVMILSGSMFAYYYLKEFGNLAIVPNHRINMTTATITMDAKPDDQRRTVPVYRAPSYTKDAADEFVADFFKRMNLDTSNMEIISYPDEGVYWVTHEQSYNIWFRFLDGSYRYTDFSNFDEDKWLKDVDEEALKESLIKFGIEIPHEALFQKVDTGTYEWTVEKMVIKNQLIDGYLTVDYYNDDTVKRIDNQLITYDKVKDVQIKSEQEAYKEILDGKFKFYSENNKIKFLHIHKIEASFYLDSKGFYQPVYAFYSTIDGVEFTILIPGI